MHVRFCKLKFTFAFLRRFAFATFRASGGSRFYILVFMTFRASAGSRLSHFALLMFAFMTFRASASEMSVALRIVRAKLSSLVWAIRK